MNDLVRRLGSEKRTIFEKHFDEIVDEYKLKAENDGYFGDLVFQKEKGRVIISVKIIPDVRD